MDLAFTGLQGHCQHLKVVSEPLHGDIPVEVLPRVYYFAPPLCKLLCERMHGRLQTEINKF